MDWEDIKVMIGITVGTLSAILFSLFIISWCIYIYDVNIGEANIITIYKGNEQIYHGKQAFVSINSGGMTTTIKVYRQLFPFSVLDKTYSSPEIKVEAE